MELQPITQIAAKAGIPEEALEPYGKWKAKISSSFIHSLDSAPKGKLVLVSAITPTKAGEGKTTTSIALAEGFGKIGQKAMLCLREPSLGPVFGIKGGATGGGKASVAPSEDINLHFTGDMHALTSSINLISAIIDNELWQGNELGIDPSRIVWKRALDMNDRALREVSLHGNDARNASRNDSFLITVASEMMAILCLAKDEEDFLARVQSIIVAYTFEGKPVTVKDLRISHAIMKLMRQALLPNLVQTLEGNPCLIHGGPFANIAHGCNSIIATSLALRLAPITITEAGFGADLGAEKFLDIKCRAGGLTPDAVVMVATIRALKMHGGQAFEDLKTPNVDALKRGVCNLEAHLQNIAAFGVPSIVAINHFASDSPKEIAFLEKWCEEKGYRYSFLDGFEKGGDGAIDLAKKVQALLQEEETHYHPIYDLNAPIKEKIETICKTIYGAKDVEYEPKALKQIEEYEAMGFADAYVCMAKTPQSLTDDPKVLGAPKGHTIHIREVNLSAGARFVIPLTGEIMTMPGLPKVPAAKKMEDTPW
ncbi:MAG: formate--tetrahydrofolate ligase [Candidatus Enteromonas sp.]|nr:formate--tetrahydrofolate ligase [Candidatus Enteromonas sp.]